MSVQRQLARLLAAAILPVDCSADSAENERLGHREGPMEPPKTMAALDSIPY